MRAGLAFLAVFFGSVLATEAGAPTRQDLIELTPGKPATVREAQSPQMPGIALVGAAGLVIAGILIFVPPDDEPAATTTGTSP
jgi:hypothetical protein